MNTIHEETTAKELDELGAGPTIKELVLNNIRFYNALILDYDLGITKNYYLTYQLNVQITKQMSDLRKANPKPVEEEDGLMTLVKELKK